MLHYDTEHRVTLLHTILKTNSVLLFLHPPTYLFIYLFIYLSKRHRNSFVEETTENVISECSTSNNTSCDKRGREKKNSTLYLNSTKNCIQSAASKTDHNLLNGVQHEALSLVSERYSHLKPVSIATFCAANTHPPDFHGKHDFLHFSRYNRLITRHLIPTTVS